jgi:hypothetical protein
MKAIETRYNGYRFRSRLKARWAVFFDTLSVQYEYEKEGYDLGQYGYYLPDFWLPAFSSWLEIKPDNMCLNDEAMKQKYWALAQQTDRVVFLFFACSQIVVTNPDTDPRIHHCGYYFTPDKDFDGMMAFGDCFLCSKITLGHWGSHQMYCTPQYDFLHCATNSQGDGEESPRILRAFEAARSARFEFGETGKFSA